MFASTCLEIISLLLTSLTLVYIASYLEKLVLEVVGLNCGYDVRGPKFWTYCRFYACIGFGTLCVEV